MRLDSLEVYLPKLKVLYALLTRPHSSRRFKISLLLFALSLFTIGSWCWYPGVISDDAYCQFLQAIGISPVSDWHPPILEAFWSLEIKLFHTANLLNATWIGLASIGLYLFIRERLCLLSYLVYALLFFSPVVLGISGFDYKDIPCAWLTLIASALLMKQRRLGAVQNHLFWVNEFFFWLCVFLVFSLRINGSFLVAPLIVARLVNWSFTISRLLLCLLAVVLLFLFSNEINRYVFHPQHTYPETSLELFDLAGIDHNILPKEERHSAFLNWKTIDLENKRSSSPGHVTRRKQDKFFPGTEDWEIAPQSNWNKATTEVKLSSCYSARQWDTLGSWVDPVQPYTWRGFDKFHNQWLVSQRSWDLQPDRRAMTCISFGDSLRENHVVLAKAWREAIMQHPIAYLHHRWRHFSTLYLQGFNSYSLLDAPIAWSYGAYYPNTGIRPQNRHRTFLAHFYKSYVGSRTRLLTYYSLFWIAVSVGLFVASIRCKTEEDKIVNVLSFASLMYILGYFFVGVGPSFRYILPSIALLLGSFLTIYVNKSYVGNVFSRRTGFSMFVMIVIMGYLI